VPAQQQRPLTLRSSSGLSAKLSSGLTSRVGLGLERDVAAEDTRAGLEIVPEYRHDFGGGTALRSTGKVFVSHPRRVALESYNTLAISLSGNLRASVDAHLFLHWDDRVRKTGVRTELQMGLGYAWTTGWIR